MYYNNILSAKTYDKLIEERQHAPLQANYDKLIGIDVIWQVIKLHKIQYQSLTTMKKHVIKYCEKVNAGNGKDLF